MSSDRVAGNIDPMHPQRKYYKCQYCGKPFWKENAFRMKYCCTECQRSAYSDSHPKKIKPLRKVIIKKCEWCGNEYEAKMQTQKYCSKQCGYEGNKRWHREKWAADFVSKTIKCKECGTEFKTECGNQHSVFCCKSCADKHERRIEHQCERHKTYMKRCKKKRDKQIEVQTVGRVDYDTIYKRDKGICGICGLPVHQEKFIDNNWGGTIDHIIPVSVGGDHAMVNCQLAHRICNSLKCKDTEGYSIDWNIKSAENNYWKNKFEGYKELMGV